MEPIAVPTGDEQEREDAAMPRRRRPRATGAPSMADVAQLAGVSGQTVSRVVNGHSAVSEPTRDRVESAMERLGYRANVAARALATGRFGTIGVVLFTLGAVGNIRIVESVVGGAQERGYSVVLASVQEPRERDVRAAVRGLTERAVDGVIVIEARVLDTLQLRLLEEVPLVIADSGASHGHPTFGMDEEAGARAAVGHLLDLGHPSVHHVAGLADSHPAQRRRDAWERLLRERGAAVPAPEVGDWSPESGYRATRRLLERGRVSAIFAANDQMAIGALRALTESGLRVPDDVSLVGFDDIDVAAYLSPPLTTVRQDLAQVGRLCLDHLLSQIEQRQGRSDGACVDADAPTPFRRVQPELVLRASAAGPSAG